MSPSPDAIAVSSFFKLAWHAASLVCEISSHLVCSSSYLVLWSLRTASVATRHSVLSCCSSSTRASLASSTSSFLSAACRSSSFTRAFSMSSSLSSSIRAASLSASLKRSFSSSSKRFASCTLPSSVSIWSASAFPLFSCNAAKLASFSRTNFRAASFSNNAWFPSFMAPKSFCSRTARAAVHTSTASPCFA